MKCLKRIEEKEKKSAKSTGKPNLLSDPRFAKVFEDPAYAIDETTREYALLNPALAPGSGAGVSGSGSVRLSSFGSRSV